jgi:nucleotide-binding universal stress UspA family protein
MAIICGTDLSLASAGALDVARVLASGRGDDEVVLVHVIDPTSDTPHDDEALARARVELEAQAAASIAARPGAPNVRTELVVGSPDQTLVSLAETQFASRIVIAARSTGGSLLRLGTTAEKVIAISRVPVLLIRDPAPLLAYASGERSLRVLLGIDDSATCDLGIQWVQALRARGPVDVVLGGIYYPDDAAERYGLHGHGMVDRDPEIEQLMGRDLERRFGDNAAGRGTVVARARRGLGRIGDHLVELAREENCDVIVIGTSQRTGLGRLGSTSSVIVHDAPQSVVCVPPSTTIVTQSVPVLRCALVATDLSPFANRAVPYAFTVTPNTGGEVHIAHVIKDDSDADVAELGRQLAALALRGASQTVHPHVIRGDDAATAIAQLAARLGADVICVASHGRAGITRALVGSVADRLLRVTRVPVLVLRPAG